MGDKEKIPGKKYIAYCKCHGWLTPDEVREEFVMDKEEDEEIEEEE